MFGDAADGSQAQVPGPGCTGRPTGRQPAS
jgi:hypothetical protein